MPVTPHAPAPYAPPSAVLEVLRRYRANDLKVPVTPEILSRLGIADTLVTRTLLSLQQLDLVDAKGMPTATMNGLRRVPEAKYQAGLLEWLNTTYAEVLRFVDPATASDNEVRAAFRSYVPNKQHSRIAALFLGLYSAAGVGTQKPAQHGGRRTPRMRPRAAVRRAKARWAAQILGDAKPPPQLVGLLVGLPPEGKGWTKAEREKFLEVFQTMLDYCVPVVKGRKD